MTTEICPECNCEMELEHIEYIQCAASATLDTSITDQIGVILPYATSQPPPRTLACNGNLYQNTQYPELAAVIDDVFRSGPLFFRTPLLNRRVPVGSGSGFVLGQTGGSETHTLTVAQMPSHRHARNSAITPEFVVFNPPGPIPGPTAAFTAGSAPYSDDEQYTRNEGGGQAHNNMQPYIVLNWCIVAESSNNSSENETLYIAEERTYWCPCCDHIETIGAC